MIKVLNLKLMIMKKYQNLEKLFAKGYIPKVRKLLELLCC